MDNREQRIDTDVGARERMTNFRFGSNSINSNLSVDRNSLCLDGSHPDLSSSLTTGTDPSSTALDMSHTMTPVGTPMAKVHARSSSHHSRSHSRTGSLSTTFTFPLKPSTMNNVPIPSPTPPGTTLTQPPPSLGTIYDSAQPIPSGTAPSGTISRSRPNSHHKRRSSVSTRRESAEIMGVSPPECLNPDSDTVVDGRRMALWALEGKGKTTRRPDFILGYTKVEIPELSETALNFGNDGDENEPPSWSSSAPKAFGSNHNSFPPLGSKSSNKRDSIPSVSFGNSSYPATAAPSGKRDSYPFFGLGSTNSGSKRDSFNGGLGLGMGIAPVSKRDSFGKFLNSCSLGDQLGTLLEEEEDMEEESLDEEDEDAVEEADETFRIVDETEDDAENNVEEPQDVTSSDMDLNDGLLPHLYPETDLASNSSQIQTLASTSATQPTPISISTTPISPLICSSASTDVSVATLSSPTTPVAEYVSSFASSPLPSSSTLATAANVSRPRPANLTLNMNNNNKFTLRPLSLTPGSLPLNARVASISGSPNPTDTPISSTGSAAYTPSPRVGGLRPLSLVAAVSSPAGSGPAQSSVTRRMSLIVSPSPTSSGSSSSVPYRRSSMSVESEPNSSMSSIASSSEATRPNYQYATLRRTSQSHLPTPGATPTSAVSPLHLGLPFGMSMMREECEEEEEFKAQSCVERDGDDTLRQDADGDASTPTGATSTVYATKLGDQHHNTPTLERPLSPTEQVFLYRSHVSLIGRISELEEIIARNQQQHKDTEHRRRGRSRGLSPGSDVSTVSSYVHRHGRFESSASNASTSTSLDSASPSISSSEPSDELLQLITDLKAERDSLMHDVQSYQLRVAELEKTISTLTRRIETERRESWVAQERMNVLEIERRCAAEEVARLKDVLKDLQVEVTEFERVKMGLKREQQRIASLENQVEAVRRDLDLEKVKSYQAEDEASMLRRKIEDMGREMDGLRALVAEQQMQILRFKQVQPSRVVSKPLNSSLNSFASTSASGSFSFTNAHSHMSSSSTLAADVDDPDGDGDGNDDAGQFKYVPFGMSPPRATLNSVAEAEEEAVVLHHRHTDHNVGDVPRDIGIDENEEDDDQEAENELAHYEDTSELDGEEQLNDDEEDVVWGEDSTTSSFGDFMPRRGISQSQTPTATPTTTPAPAGRPGHARVGSMEKGWSFATARANVVQSQSHFHLDLTPTSKFWNSSHGTKAESKAKVDRFFGCLDGLEDEEDDGDMITVNVEFSDSKRFWSGVVQSEDDGVDLPPFLLPASTTNTSASASPSNSDLISEEEEEEAEDFATHLATPAPTPSWKDLISAKLDVVIEEEEEELDEEDEDNCPPSPSLRPTLARIGRNGPSLLPRPSSSSNRTSTMSLVPPSSVLSQMTPNTLKTTLDATVRSPPSTSATAGSNRWSIVGASLGLGLPSTPAATAADTPAKARYSLSPSTPSSVLNLKGGALPTPPPTLIPRLVSKSGLSSPTSPMSPSPVPSVSPGSSPVPSPLFGEFADREGGLSTPTPMSKYGSLSPSRIPTPSRKIFSKEQSTPAIIANGNEDHNSTSRATNSSTRPFFSNDPDLITHSPFSISHQGEGMKPGSARAGIERHGHDCRNDDKTDDDTLVAMRFRSDNGEIRGGVDGGCSRSKWSLDFDDTRSSSSVFSHRMERSSDENGDTRANPSPTTATTTFGGFATRLTRFWKGGEDRPALLSPTNGGLFRPQDRHRPAYISREKQIEVLRARMRRNMQGESQGCRMKDEVISFVGCSQCADSPIIVL